MCAETELPQGWCCLHMRNELGGKFNLREGNKVTLTKECSRDRKIEEILFNILWSLSLWAFGKDHSDLPSGPQGY